MSGFIGYLFGVLLAVSLTLMGVHWHDRKWRAIWISVSGVCIVIIIASGAIYYLSPPASTIVPHLPQKKERAYVILKESNLEGLAPQKKFVTIVVENTGAVAIDGRFTNFTAHFASSVPARDLVYIPNGVVYEYKLLPRETRTMRVEFEGPSLNDEQIRMLNEHRAQLFFFGQGEYTDPDGNVYPLPYCRRFDPDWPHGLVFCDQEIDHRASWRGQSFTS
jgi:hypothetical protein